MSSFNSILKLKFLEKNAQLFSNYFIVTSLKNIYIYIDSFFREYQLYKENFIILKITKLTKHFFPFLNIVGPYTYVCFFFNFSENMLNAFFNNALFHSLYIIYNKKIYDFSVFYNATSLTMKDLSLSFVYIILNFFYNFLIIFYNFFYKSILTIFFITSHV